MNRSARRQAERSARRAPPPNRVRPYEKLNAGQVRDLGLCHIINLDAIANGTATVDTLWQWVGGVLTWSKAAELVGIGIDEMSQQIELSTAIIERFKKTGRVGFSRPEYQMAKAGVEYMDELATITPKSKAIEATNWSEKRLNELAQRNA